jgi:hypothetical protein
MPTFIDMSALTLKSSASGQEEIQVSESNKINTSQIAALTFSQDPSLGNLPISNNFTYGDSKVKLWDMLRLLTAAANIGRLRIVTGNLASGAPGKPEMAFIVNILQGTNAETGGTNGLQIFHLTDSYIRVIPSSSIPMAWLTLQTLTDEAIIKKLHSTAYDDWGGMGVMMEWAGGGGSGGSAMKYLTVTDFKSNTFSNCVMGDIAVGEMFTFTSADDAANGPGSALVGYAVKISASSIKYVGTSISINTYKRSYLYTYQSTNIYATNWSILGTPTGIEASVYEFTYGEGGGVPTGDLKFVKVADIFRMIFSTPDQADYGQLDFIRSQDSAETDQYVFICPSVGTGSTFNAAIQRIAVNATTGAVDMTGVSLAIKDLPATKIQVSNFNNPTNISIRNLAVGQGVIICTAGTIVGGPSGVTAPLYGHCFRSSSGPVLYTYLLQTADGSRTFSGSTNGTTAQWTELGGGGAQTVIKLPGSDVELNQSNGAIIPYGSTELAKLSPGVTLMLCFEMADSDGRFSPSGNVVVYYDLPSAHNSWNTIAGFFDSATSSNGSINVRRRAAGVLDFQCTSGLLEGYPGLQVYLKHIFVLG